MTTETNRDIDAVTETETDSVSDRARNRRTYTHTNRQAAIKIDGSNQLTTKRP